MSVGSLTTTFTPPASCLASFSTTGWSSIDPLSGFFFAGPLATPGCMPPNYRFSTSCYYSPGVCPVGYATACSSVNTVGIISETVVTCCPTSYACNTAPYLAQYPWQATYGCESVFNSQIFPSVVVVSGTNPVSTVGTTAIGGAVNALSVQIRYQSTDFQSKPTSSSSIPTPTSTTTTASISSTSGSAGSGGGHGISSGAAAGIGVGSAALALLLAGAFVFVYTLGRRRRLADSPTAVLGVTQKNTGPSYTAVSRHPVEMPTA